MDRTIDYLKIEKRTRTGKLISNILIYTLLALWGLIVLFPFYWMLLTSVKSYGSYNAEHIPSFFTLSPTLQNYVDAFTTVALGKYLLNTLIFTLATTAIMLVVITLAAFAFARLDFKGKNLVFTLFLSLMMIPNELVVITNFTTVTNLGMRNTFLGLILPSVTSVFYIYLLKENFAQIPDELYYAAKVDGTSDLRYLRRVMIPICKPTLITIIILKIIECWNSCRVGQTRKPSCPTAQGTTPGCRMQSRQSKAPPQSHLRTQNPSGTGGGLGTTAPIMQGWTNTANRPTSHTKNTNAVFVDGSPSSTKITARNAVQRWTKGRKAMIDDFDGAEILHCPYCGRAQDTHEDDEISANCCLTECEHCGKSFWYSVEVTRAYWPRKDEGGEP